MGTEQTEDICRRYFAGWTTRDSATVRSLLAEDFEFEAATMTVSGRDAFLEAGAFPAGAEPTMVAQAYQGDVGLQMYDATNDAKQVRIVEKLVVRDGLIRSSTFVTDNAAFMAFLGIG